MKHSPLEDLDALMLERSAKEWEEHQPKERHSVTSYCTFRNGETEGKCLRSQFFDWMAVKPTNVPPKDVYRNRVGNLLHDDLYNLWEDAGYEVATENDLTFVHNPDELTYPVKGRPDAILSKDGETFHVSVKTTHGMAFRYNLIKDDHVRQISYEMRFEPMGGCDHHIIYYFSREDFNRRIAVMGKDFEYVDTSDYSGWIELEKYLKSRKLPPRYHEEMDKFPCSSIKKGHRKTWCWHFDYCWEICKKIEGKNL